jgi:hypothetical protein
MPESDFRNVPKQKNFTGTADRNTQTENAGFPNPDFSLTDRTRLKYIDTTLQDTGPTLAWQYTKRFRARC